MAETTPPTDRHTAPESLPPTEARPAADPPSVLPTVQLNGRLAPSPVHDTQNLSAPREAAPQSMSINARVAGIGFSTNWPAAAWARFTAGTTAS